jgi:hypothetical protein
MKRSERCHFLYPANPEANNNRKLNKYGGMREKDGRLGEFCLYLLSHVSFNFSFCVLIGASALSKLFNGLNLYQFWIEVNRACSITKLFFF